MKFFESIDTVYLVAALFVAFLIGHFIVQRKNSLKLSLQYRLVFYGFVMVILWFSLPSTPSLASFGYPEDVSDIETKERLLKYLQKYNQAIVRTTQIVSAMMFITAFWLVTIISSIIRHFKLEKPTE